MKTRFTAINYLITAGLGLIFIFLAILHYSSNSISTEDLKSQTNTIVAYEQYDKKWYDDLLGTSKGSVFRLWLEDNSCFEATGIHYDNIDRKLFEEIETGKEITITYFELPGGLGRICAIEYQGENYLSLQKVLSDHEQNEKFTRNLENGIFIISISAAFILYTINYVKYYKYAKKGR